eukprot:GFKZ01010478.1.p1 GENE.GFKZ01010478.1~~GFKZ01010478.1.p1  ORF type:complete len:919 (-),score=157.90 GFKZ01010478.1:1333-4089(-)
MMTAGENQPPPPDDRLNIFDTLANIGDRTVKPDALRYLIDQTCRDFSEKLASGNPQYFEFIGVGLKQCGIRLPHKAPVYATIAALLTAGGEHYAADFAKTLAEVVSKELATSIRDGRSSLARRALRFLACLACGNMVAPGSVAEYLFVLLDAALYELTTAHRSENGVHCRGEFLADIALSALPWAGPMLAEHANGELTKIMDTVRQIEEAWSSGKWRCIAPATDQRCVEAFSELIDAIFVLQHHDWRLSETVIPRPYEEFKGRLEGGCLVQLEGLVIPAHSKITLYSAPRFRLQLVNAKSGARKDVVGVLNSGKGNKDGKKVATGDVKSDKASVKPEDPVKVEGYGFNRIVTGKSGADNGKSGQSSINDRDVTMTGETNENKNSNGVSADPTSSAPFAMSNGIDNSLPEKFVLRTYIADIVDNFSTNHVMAAERLLTVPMLHKVDDEIVEGLFSQLCAMPEPTFAPVYYGTLFVDLCRVKDSRLPIKLLTAVEAMFQDAALFDPESFDRLTDWFSFHLSNFEYKWNWSDWAVYADVDMVDKFPFRALFCQDVLARCIRLSYYERILDVVPEEMKYFLPPKPNNGNRMRFDDVVNDNLMKVVTGKDKQDAKVVKERLAALIPVRSRPEDTEEYHKAELKASMLRLSALIRAILQAGSKTLSHFDTVCERYLSLLIEMAEVGGEAAKKLITLEVNSFWDNVHIRRMYVLDRLSMHRVIDGMAIIDSVLTEHRHEGDTLVPLSDEQLKKNLGQSNSWEIIRLVMHRARAREEGARSELTAASRAAAIANEGETESAESRLEAAKNSVAKAKTEISGLLLLSFRKLFAICKRLLGDDAGEEDDMEKSEYNRNLPGFDDKPVWYWRCVGMIRELARKHPVHLAGIVEKLEAETGDARERHQELWDSFEIIREVEGCAMLIQVW